MQGVCFQQVGQVARQTLADPTLQTDHDAIVRVQMAGLCGSDLHPFFGREAGLDPGTVMGHEFVGEIVAVGTAVSTVNIGDRVCAPFTTNCGNCFYCRTGLTSRCERGQLFGWRHQGHGLHGGQATMVRVPLADATLMKIPAGMSDETAILIGDNLSTGEFAADLVGIDPAGVSVVIGCGTVGLLAITAAIGRGAQQVIAVDPVAARRQLAETLGAVACDGPAAATAAVDQRTDGRGADGVMELVGLPPAQQLAYRLLRPGGTMAVIGCHCTPHFAFSPSDAYDKNLTYRTGRCPARQFMSRLALQWPDQPRDFSWCITHRFTIDQAEQAYRVFAGQLDGCVKAVFRF